MINWFKGIRCRFIGHLVEATVLKPKLHAHGVKVSNNCTVYWPAVRLDCSHCKDIRSFHSIASAEWFLEDNHKWRSHKLSPNITSIKQYEDLVKEGR